MEEAIPVRYVFVMLLAIADSEGDVVGTDIAIARRLNMPVEEFQKCVAVLGTADPDSNSKDMNGRRVVPSDSERGYRVVNYAKYRELTTEFQKKNYMRRYMREYREKGKVANDVKLTKSYSKTDANTLDMPSLTSASVSESVSGKGSVEGKGFPTLEQAKERAKFIGVPESDAEQFWHHFNSTGWLDKNGHTIKNWESKLVTWKLTNQQQKYGNSKYGKAGQQTNPRLVGICRNPETDYGKAAEQKVARQMAETKNQEQSKPSVS